MGDEDRENDPLQPEAWYQEPDVCGSCIAWRPEPKEGDEVATGLCRLRPELGRVPASLKLCNLYKPRGQFVYQPGKEPTPKRKRASPAKVLKRTESGEMEEAAPPPAVYTKRETPPEEQYVPPREIDMGEDASLPAIRATFRDLIREEHGNSRREMQKKFKGGVVKVAIRTGPYLEYPADLLFTILDRLKSSLDALEAKLEKSVLKEEAEQVKRIRGSFTTFNVMWSDREDYFTGKE